MAAEHDDRVEHAPLGAKRLREYIREARGGFAPDYVARALRHRMIDIRGDEVEEIAELLEELLARARGRLGDAGIEPGCCDPAVPLKLSKREREYAANVAILCAWRALCLLCVDDRREEGMDLLSEGFAWCGAAGASREEAVLWRICANGHRACGRLAEEEGAIRSGVDAARLGGNREDIVLMLYDLASFLIVRQRLDEADATNDEAIAIVREEPGGRDALYGDLLVNKGRILMMRTEYVESISVLREALRWIDPELAPQARAAAMAHLGSVYLRLDNYRQSIECQHEVVRLGSILGSDMLRGWGYYRLAEAHLRLNELEMAIDALDRAAEYGIQPTSPLTLAIACKRAQAHAMRDEFDRGVELCLMILRDVDGLPLPDPEVFAHTMLAEIEERQGRYAGAVEHYQRAISVSDRAFPQRTPALKIALSALLHKLGRHAEVAELVETLASLEMLSPSEQVTVFNLRALLAEDRGDLRAALDHQREAFALERSLLERRAEESLRNAQIIARTDLLEREADIERERRRRLEHELAEVVMELSDSRRIISALEQRLRKALEHAGPDAGSAAVGALRQALSDLHADAAPHESPLRYLGDVDRDFCRRMRSRWPDLTPKQERLCALTRAGLASKEIASLMDLEPEGLKAQRKRLRRKLGLSPGERLEVVLADL